TETKSRHGHLMLIDIGNGTGVIPITLKLEDPTLTVHASDISQKALSIAKQNATNLGASITFHQSDFLQNWLGSRERFDLIVSNPLYIAHEEREHISDTVKHFDPELARLAVNNGLAAYQAIIGQATKALAKEGLLSFKIAHQQAEAGRTIIEANFPKAVVE